MTRIYLVRHAQAEGNLYRRAQGAYDSLVTPQGYAQINALKERFADIPVQVVYSSPRYRTRTTASAIYGPKNIPMYILNDLREVDCGPWEDRTWGDIRYHEKEQLENFTYHFDRWHIEGAETAEEVRDRMLRTMDTVVRECPDMTVAVVTHGMAARILLGTLQGMSLTEISENFPHGDNTAVSLIEYEDGRYRVVYANDTRHLTESISTFAKQSWWKGRQGEEIGLRFLPLDLERDADGALYHLCHAEAWRTRRGSMDGYCGETTLQQAKQLQKLHASVLLAAYHEDQFAGILQLDRAEEGVSLISALYLTADYRGKGLGIQLIGEAVSRSRRDGRNRLRAICGQGDAHLQHFYRSCGFRKTGEMLPSDHTMEILELYIGF